MQLEMTVVESACILVYRSMKNILTNYSYPELDTHTQRKNNCVTFHWVLSNPSDDSGVNRIVHGEYYNGLLSTVSILFVGLRVCMSLYRMEPL